MPINRLYSATVGSQPTALNASSQSTRTHPHMRQNCSAYAEEPMRNRTRPDNRPRTTKQHSNSGIIAHALPTDNLMSWRGSRSAMPWILRWTSRFLFSIKEQTKPQTTHNKTTNDKVFVLFFLPMSKNKQTTNNK